MSDHDRTFAQLSYSAEWPGVTLPAVQTAGDAWMFRLGREVLLRYSDGYQHAIHAGIIGATQRYADDLAALDRYSSSI